MGLVDLNRILISTKSTNWYSCYEIQELLNAVTEYLSTE